MAAVGGGGVGDLASWNLECGKTLGSKGVGGDLASWNPLSVVRHCGDGMGVAAMAGATAMAVRPWPPALAWFEEWPL